jgi:hypothetical protein
MGFITHCCKSALEQRALWTRAWLRLSAVCLLAWTCTVTCALTGIVASAWAQAPAIELTELRVERQDNAIVLSSNVRLELGAAVEDALLKGVAIHFVAEATVMRERWYWYDTRQTGAVRHYRLAYQALTRRWRLTLSNEALGAPAASGSLSQQFDSLGEAMSAIRRNLHWKVAEVSELDPDTKYTLNYQFRIDTSQLPRPFQITAGGQNEWNLALSRTMRLPNDLVR